MNKIKFLQGPKDDLYIKNTDGTVTFTYLEEGKIIQIDAPDEATMNEILK